MKIKVDKEEYEHLLERVKKLEDDDTNSWERLCDLERRLRLYVDNYFKNKCEVVMIKRDKEQVVAEVREQALNNIFKEQE